MYKRASRNLQHAHRVDQIDPSKGVVDGPIAAPSEFPDIECMSFNEAQDERARLEGELRRCIVQLAASKTAGESEASKLLGLRQASLQSRLLLTKQRMHQTVPEQSRKGIFRRAVREIVDEETWGRILARRDELVNTLTKEPPNVR